MEPKSQEEYLKKFNENTIVEGYGAETTQIIPCPFCAAPGFMKWKILEVEQVLTAGATCQKCNRSARAVFQRDQSGVRFEIVQTGGPPQPEWLVPHMRVQSDDESPGLGKTR